MRTPWCGGSVAARGKMTTDQQGQGRRKQGQDFGVALNVSCRKLGCRAALIESNTVF